VSVLEPAGSTLALRSAPDLPRDPALVSPVLLHPQQRPYHQLRVCTPDREYPVQLHPARQGRDAPRLFPPRAQSLEPARCVHHAVRPEIRGLAGEVGRARVLHQGGREGCEAKGGRAVRELQVYPKGHLGQVSVLSRARGAR
jgi:hypothetical protein